MKVNTLARRSLALCIASISMTAAADNKMWVGYENCGSNDWSTDSCWQSVASETPHPGGPLPMDDVYLTGDSLWGEASVIYRGPNAPVDEFNNLFIDALWNSTWTLEQEGNIASNMEMVGVGGYGNHLQRNGTNTIATALVLGHNFYSRGGYTIEGGALAAKDIVVGNVGGGRFEQGSDTSGSSPTVTVSETLKLGQTLGRSDSAEYVLKSGSLTAKNEIVGEEGHGQFTQTGGTNTVAETLTIARSSDTQNIVYWFTQYLLQAGQLQAANVVVGDGTIGTFEQQGGATVVTDTLTIGNRPTNFPTTASTYTLKAGTLTAKNIIVGNETAGKFTQEDGTVTVSETLTVGKQPRSSLLYYSPDEYTLAAGSLATKNVVISDAAAARFTQNGGTHTVAETLTIGRQDIGPYAQGGYTLQAGTITAKNIIVGDAGSGTFSQYGGTNTVSQTLVLGKQLGASGYYGLTDGILSAHEEVLGDGGYGNFSQNGGTHTVATTLTVAKQAGSFGLYDQFQGTLSADNMIVGDGGNAFVYQYGTIAVANTLTLGKQAGGTASYYLYDKKLSARDMIVGDAGYATMNQGYGWCGPWGGCPNGAATAIEGTLTVGRQASGSGYFSVNSGTLTAKHIVLGDAGSGSISQGENYGYSASVKADTLTLGKQAGSYGGYSLYAGVLEVLDQIVGDAGRGSFYQSGANSTNTVSGTLTIGKQAGSEGYYALAAGTLSANDEVIGDAGTGEFNQWGGTHTVAGTLTLGKQAGGQGFYYLSAGQVTSGNLIVGDAGSGEFWQYPDYFGYSSSNTVSGTLTLGKQAGSKGVYGLFAGALRAVNEIVGDGGVGVFEQGGGTNEVAQTLTLGKQAGSEGFYKLSAGALLATDEIIGDAGIGTFTQGEGSYGYSASNTVSGTLTLGKQAGSQGIYNLLAGVVSAQNTVVGDAGIGTFSQLGGKHAVEGDLTLGKQAEGLGVYNLSGGELTTARTVVGDAGAGTFTHSAGTHTTQSLTLGKQADSYGAYYLLGGTLTATETVVGDAGIGVFTQTGGTHNVGTLTLGKQASGSGTYNLRGGNLNVGGDIVGGAGKSALLISGGALNFGAGNHEVDVDTFKVSGQGSVKLTDGAAVTFESDVVHNGKAIDLAGGTRATFNGAFSGKGPFTGAGTAIFNGVLNVGDGPVAFSAAGNVELGAHSKSIFEVGGTTRGSGYDAFDVGGSLLLDGELNLVALNGFNADLGDVFDLFTAETISGEFDLLKLLVLGDGLSWKVEYLIDAIGTKDVMRVSVVSSVPLPASVWLLQSALFGLFAMRRYGRRKQ